MKDKNKIPKIIHQIFGFWDNNEEMSVQWKKNMNQWKEYHSKKNGWKHILWDYKKSENLIKEHYPLFLDIWNNYKYPIQKCDAIRYFILYHYGGIYSDLDISPKNIIDKLLIYDIVLAQTPNFNGLTNSFMMSSKNNKFFKLLINNLSREMNSFDNLGKHFHVMYSAGPNFLTKYYKIAKNKKLLNHYEVLIINSRKFKGSCNACKCNKNDSYYFNHTTGKSWHSFSSSWVDKIYCNSNSIYIFLIIVFIFYFFIY